MKSNVFKIVMLLLVLVLAVFTMNLDNKNSAVSVSLPVQNGNVNKDAGSGVNLSAGSAMGKLKDKERFEDPERNISVYVRRWNRSLNDNFMKIGGAVRNDNTFEIKGVKIRCTLYGKDGREVERKIGVLEANIPAGVSYNFNDFFMGYVRQGAEHGVCTNGGIKKD